MNLKNYFTMGLMFAAVALAQSSDQSAQTAASGNAASSANSAADSGDDQFGGLRKQANAARDKWRQLESTVFEKQIPAIRDNCSPKINVLIDSVKTAMEAYMTLEGQYTKIWADDSRRKLQMVTSTIAAEGTMTTELSGLLADEKNDLAETMRRKEELEKLGSTAADVAAEADELVKQMNETQAKIQETIAQMDEISGKTQASEILVKIREAKLKEYSTNLQTALLGLETLYLKRKESYNARCLARDAKPPDFIPRVDFGSDKSKP